MESWLHCNTCFLLPSSESVQFHLTSCGHIFCTTCLNKNLDKECKTCGQTYAGAIPLSSRLKPDVQLYFTDMKDVCKNIMKQVQQAQLVSEFQKGHSQRLHSHQKQKLHKLTEMMHQARELERQYREVLWENDKLKNFVLSMGYQVQDVLGRVSKSYPMTPKTPVTPGVVKAPVTPGFTPGLKRTHSNQSMASINSQRPSPINNRVTPGKSLGRPGSSPMQQSPSHRHIQPSPGGGAMQRGSMRRTPGINPTTTPKSIVASGRITMRTPPINGKLGPISKSPHLSNQQLRSPASSQIIHPNRTPVNRAPSSASQPPPSSSKIGQNLIKGGSLSMMRPPPDERRPIQLHSARSSNPIKRSDSASTPKP